MPATAIITAIAGLGLAGATTVGVVSAVDDNAQHTTPTSSTGDYVPYGATDSATPADSAATPSPSDVPSSVPSHP